MDDVENITVEAFLYMMLKTATTGISKIVEKSTWRVGKFVITHYSYDLVFDYF